MSFANCTRRILPLTALFLSISAVSQVRTDTGPVRLIVGYQAGGSADIQARTLAPVLAEELGMSVVVDNKTGAGGQLAADSLRTAPADGLTILYANMHMMVMLPLTSKSVRYDPLKHFQAVGQVASFYEAIAVPGDHPAKTVDEWLGAARTNSKLANYAVPATGSVAQFMGYQLGREAKVDLVAVPYRGAAPVINDLVGGQVPAAIVPVGDLLPYKSAGRVKILAVNGSRRAPLAPDVPTLKELGKKGFDTLEWTGLFVPAGTPTAIVKQLNAALAKALAKPDVQERILKLNNMPTPGTPSELRQLIVDDLAHWGPIVKASGFVAE